MEPRSRVTRYVFDIEGFKAIRAARLVVDGLTVIVGANSSGKSSLGQSLLVLSRATDSRDGRIKLNDQVLSLGRFGDVLNKDSNHIRLAAERYDSIPPEYVANPEEGNQQKLELESMQRVSFKLEESKGARTEAVVLTKTNHQPDIRRVDYRFSEGSLLGEVLKDMDQLSIIEISSDSRLSQINYARLSRNEEFPYFENSVRLMKTTDYLTMKAREFGFRNRRKYNANHEEVDVSDIKTQYEDWSIGNQTALESSDLKKLSEMAHDLNLESGMEFTENVSGRIGDKDELVNSEIPGELSNLLSELWISLENEDEVYEKVLGKLSEVFMEDEYIWTKDPSLSRLEFFSDFFRLSTNFLGPLRKRSLSRSFSETFDVANAPLGTDGGQLASVLHEKFNLKEKRKYPAPSGEVDSLKTALGDWLAYFDMPHVIEAEETQDGYLITLAQSKKKGQPKRRLDEYGTGVSQLLPVIAMILMASENELSVIEQPELHLHPLAQIKLADFLMKCSQYRNIVVETHSEYLVTRLRRNVALGVVQNGIPRPSLYFVEPRDGYSEVIEAEIPDSGGDDSWPDRFSGFTESDELDILETNIQSEESASD